MMIGLSTPLKGVMKEIVWPLAAMLLALIIITCFPETVLFLQKLAGLCNPIIN